MTVFRAAAVVATLFFMVCAQPVTAQSSEAVSEISHARSVAFQQARLRLQCPRLCVEWFDGCNNCTCGKGRVDVCTMNYCTWHRRARCLRYGF